VRDAVRVRWFGPGVLQRIDMQRGLRVQQLDVHCVWCVRAAVLRWLRVRIGADVRFHQRLHVSACVRRRRSVLLCAEQLHRGTGLHLRDVLPRNVRRVRATLLRGKQLSRLPVLRRVLPLATLRFSQPLRAVRRR
jgi:hypothetical protein